MSKIDRVLLPHGGAGRATRRSLHALAHYRARNYGAFHKHQNQGTYYNQQYYLPKHLPAHPLPPFLGSLPVYNAKFSKEDWRARQESNLQPLDSKSTTLSS